MRLRSKSSGCHRHPVKTFSRARLTLLFFVLAGTFAFAQTNQYPFQNPAMALEDRVDNIVTLMTLDEKVAFFSSRPGVPRLGIHAMGHVEGLHGLAHGGPSNWGRRNPVPTTIFPQAYGLGETWDPEILHQVAAVEGYETRYIAQNPKYGGHSGLDCAGAERGFGPDIF